MDLEAIDVEEHEFEVVRRGYDQLQVAEFLKKVGRAMARLEERNKIAEVKAEQLDRELRDVRTRAETTIQETVIARAQLIAASADENGDDPSRHSASASLEMSSMKAQQIIERATRHASAIQAEAAAVLEGALSTSAKINDDRRDLLGSVEAERLGLIASAAAEAEAIRAAALEEAEMARAESARLLQELRSEAMADADRALRNADARAAQIIASAETRSRELEREPVPPIQSEVMSPLETKVAAAADGPVDTFTADEEEERIVLDLREESDRSDPEPVGRAPRTSRYKSRSANLPRIGDDAGSVIGSLESLRNKE